MNEPTHDPITEGVAPYIANGAPSAAAFALGEVIAKAYSSVCRAHELPEDTSELHGLIDDGARLFFERMESNPSAVFIRVE